MSYHYHLTPLLLGNGLLHPLDSSYEAGYNFGYLNTQAEIDMMLGDYDSATAHLGEAYSGIAIALATKGIGKTVGAIEKGVLNDANWAQSTINSSEKFTLAKNKKTYYTNQFGVEINTVDDLANAIKNGTIKADDIIIDYVINENGTKLILNTRTSVALERAGIPKDQWVGRDQTGNKVPNMGDATFDELAQRQLNNNNLPLDGTSTPPLGSQ